jgi:hypothetical protein
VRETNACKIGFLFRGYAIARALLTLGRADRAALTARQNGDAAPASRHLGNAAGVEIRPGL